MPAFRIPMTSGPATHPDDLSAIAGLWPRLRVAREVRFLSETESTNVELTRLAEGGAAEGLALVADYQSAGRGRLARRWEAPPGTSLLTSVLLRPPLPAGQAALVTMLAATSVACAVRRVSGLSPIIKWPNDLLLQQRKFCGILASSTLAGERIQHVVVGIGINVNFRVPPGSSLAGVATTLLEQLGRPVSRLALAQALFVELDAGYSRLLAGGEAQIRSEWRSRLYQLGKRVRVDTGRETLEGTAEDVADDGSLLVRLPGGALVAVAAGETAVRVRE